MWGYDSYKNWLRGKLIEIRDSLDFQDYAIEVFNEQDYAKNRSIKPKTITVVVKFLNSTLVFSVKTQPIQMLIISEENGLSVANSIITQFAETYNFSVIPDGNTYVKHMYSTPAVLSNFNLIGIGMRTVLYINTTLFVLEGVMDIKDLTVTIEDINNDDPIPIDAISATIGYTMSGDTQPFGGGFAQTVKNFATFSMTINVSCVKTPFTQRCVEVMNGTSAKKGNDSFVFNFSVGDIQFSNFSMKLIGCTLSTAVNNVPSLQMSFSV